MCGRGLDRYVGNWNIALPTIGAAMADDVTLPPEMLPRSPGADVIIVCPSCEWQWVPEDEKCPNCGRGVVN